MKIAVVVLADGFEEIEAVTPIDLLRRSGVRVVVAGVSGLLVTGARGVVVGCDTTLGALEPGWDALVIPGGQPGASTLAGSVPVKNLLTEAFDRGALVGAICASPAVVLGSLGFLEGRSYTGYPGTPGPSGARYLDQPVVVDGNLVTSRGVGTAAAFGLMLVERLAGPERAAEVARATLLV